MLNTDMLKQENAVKNVFKKK